MPNPLIPRLEQCAPLTAEARDCLEQLGSERVRRYGPREDVVREGDRPGVMRLVLAGWACRYKQLPDGRRQIVGFFLPGDTCDHNIYVLREMDHTVATLTAVTLAEIGRQAIERVTRDHPIINDGLWRETLITAAIQREWSMNLGQRDALERIAHLFCELYHRLRIVGLAAPDGYEMPLTQSDIADAVGITPVHVNRSIQELRARGLVVLRNRQLTIPNLAALEAAALFNRNYLHMACASEPAAGAPR